jgi:chemotaxis protein CheC
MQPDGVGGLLPGDLEVLQELMNIAFGKAAADAAVAHGGQLELTVPDVQVMPAVLLRYYVSAELKEHARLGVLEQAFHGELEGSALLLLPGSEAGQVLAAVGPILVGACVEKLAELLGAAVTLGTAVTAVEDRRAAAARAGGVAADSSATVLRALFRLGQPGEAGYLFLVVAGASTPWVGSAVRRFMARYA